MVGEGQRREERKVGGGGLAHFILLVLNDPVLGNKTRKVAEKVKVGNEILAFRANKY